MSQGSGMYTLQGETLCVLNRVPEVEIRKTGPTGESWKASVFCRGQTWCGTVAPPASGKSYAAAAARVSTSNAAVQTDLISPNTEDKFK